ncbi:MULTISPECIES: YdcF family protein [Stenotrophomonas]|uniref:Protein sanA-like protein n=1 Tax=Stenotrophomonas nitritireducens TaxID=83617 RepID=A0A9D8PVC7_9GAMM|nr:MULTISPECIES: YdcF family protein [Stenotrophomonas]KQN95601.1 protein sanA-like protein [Stenotrophomonas sp. Leaf70]KRG58581.1 protein sanA-like protein [Stenotrophomonas nitritireducens]MBN8793838.1 YdcF family protein [Stenotrophomonas nitritireducens]MBN8796276.1 YdcF family protein [Stenotrophomonas nitritireducens]MBN8799945.1 YdcF family protein [Stenotrophomonas nitritireducens]
MDGRVSRKRAGLFDWLWRLCVLVLLWLLGVAAWIIWVGDRDQAAPADAIIVLGAAAYDAKPSPVFEERIRHGLDLYRQGYAPKLIFTGGFGGTGARFSESQVARRYALKQEIPATDILIENRSRTTRQNLVEAKRLMDAHGMRRAILVSDPLHMARALRLSRELGIDALASSTPSTRFRSFHTSWRFLAQEIYFFHRDLFAGAT